MNRLIAGKSALSKGITHLDGTGVALFGGIAKEDGKNGMISIFILAVLFCYLCLTGSGLYAYVILSCEIPEAFI